MAFSLKAQRQNKVGLSWGSFRPPSEYGLLTGLLLQDTGKKAVRNDLSKPVQHSSSTKKQRHNQAFFTANLCSFSLGDSRAS